MKAVSQFVEQLFMIYCFCNLMKECCLSVNYVVIVENHVSSPFNSSLPLQVLGIVIGQKTQLQNKYFKIKTL